MVYQKRYTTIRMNIVQKNHTQLWPSDKKVLIIRGVEI